MRTIATLLLLTGAALAQDAPSAMDELRRSIEMAPDGAKATAELDARIKALESRPSVGTICFQMQITINQDLGIETAKSIHDLLEDGIPRIVEACRSVGVP